MQGSARRILLLVAAGVAVWYAVVLVSWATRPLTDTIPIGVNPKDGKAVSQEVECNTLFAGNAHDGPLPVLPTLLPLYAGQYEYNRAACELVQRDARVVFGIDTLAAIALVGGSLFLVFRRPASTDPITPPGRASYA